MNRKKRHEKDDDEEEEHEINIFRFSARYSRMLYISTLDLIEVELFQVNAFVTNGCPSQWSKHSHVDGFFLLFLLLFWSFLKRYYFCFELNYLSEAYNIEYIRSTMNTVRRNIIFMYGGMAEVKNKDTVVKYACKNSDFTYENHIQIGRSAVTYEIFKRQWEKSRQKKIAKT